MPKDQARKARRTPKKSAPSRKVITRADAEISRNGELVHMSIGYDLYVFPPWGALETAEDLIHVADDQAGDDWEPSIAAKGKTRVTWDEGCVVFCTEFDLFSMSRETAEEIAIALIGAALEGER